MMKLVALLFTVFLLAKAQAPPSDGKIRVYVADSQSWQMNGGWSASKGSGSGYQSGGGANPQTAEIVRTVNERCPGLAVTNNQDRAAFALILDHDDGIGALARKNKIAVFNRDGDVVFSRSAWSLGNAVKDACEAITATTQIQTWTGAAPQPAAPATNLAQPVEATRPAQASRIPAPARQPDTAANSLVDVTFASNPPGALVYFGKAAFSKTPFVTKLPPGKYPIKMKLEGHPDWDAEISVESGKPATVVAQLNSTTGVVLK